MPEVQAKEGESVISVLKDIKREIHMTNNFLARIMQEVIELKKGAKK
jgi:hypothetical protein